MPSMIAKLYADAVINKPNTNSTMETDRWNSYHQEGKTNRRYFVETNSQLVLILYCTKTTKF